MSHEHELVMDVSKEIFTLNKEILSFKINPQNSKLSSHSSIHSGDIKPLSEENIEVTNLTSDYLAFRTKTTKKEHYAVNPTYCVIPPNGTKSLNFVFYNKTGGKINPKGHKFKFEGFIIPEAQKDEDIKKIFQENIKKGKKVVGNSQKRYVQFSEDNENNEEEILRGSNSSLSSSNISNYTVPPGEEENLRMSDIVDQKSGGRFGMPNNKEKYESLKKEYEQLKEQVENLKRNEELLNKRIYNERNKNNEKCIVVPYPDSALVVRMCLMYTIQTAAIVLFKVIISFLGVQPVEGKLDASQTGGISTIHTLDS